MGYDSSMMNGLQILPSYTKFFNLNDSTRGLNNAVLWMGGFLAVFVSPPICNIAGRRYAMIYGVILTVIGIIIQTAAVNEAMFAISRIIIGFGNCMSGIAGAILVSETVRTEWRAFTTAGFFVFYYIGGLISALVNYGSESISSTWSWRLPSLIQLVGSIVCLMAISFVPESPRWLLAMGKKNYAREIVAIYVSETQNPESLEARAAIDELDVELEEENCRNSEKSWKDIFNDKANYKRLAALVSFSLMIELAGSFEVSYYLTDMLESAGIRSTISQLQVNVVLQVWCFFVALVGAFTLEVLGRKKQGLIGCVGMILSLYATGALTKFYGFTTYEPGIYATVAMIFIFQGFYSFSITPLTSLYATELFPFKTRAVGYGICMLIDEGTGLLASFVFSFAMENMGWKFYILNASYDIIFLFGIIFCWIETKGKSLEQISEIIEGRGPSTTIEVCGEDFERLNNDDVK